MNQQNIKVLGLLAAAIGAGPVAAADYGCPVGEPAYRLAATYNEQWREAMRSGNADRLAELYTENAVLMPPTDETIVGRAPIGQYFAEPDHKPSLGNYTVDLVACEFDGDSLNIAGVWGAQQIDYRGRSNTISGNLMRVLDRQTDGSWALRYEIWN